MGEKNIFSEVLYFDNLVRIFFVFFIFIFLIKNISGKTTSDTITTNIQEDKFDRIFNDIEKTYEISQNALNRGYEIDINGKSMLSFFIFQKKYSLVVANISFDKITLVFFDDKTIDVNLNETKMIDLDNDAKFDITLTLNSINDDVANIYVKNYIEKTEVSGNYKELFDIEVGLKDEKIKDSKDLIIYIKFVNFGEGPSQINIVYSIYDSNGTEVYRGIDDKVVYTEESLIKNFDFLKLPIGKYKLSSKIYYGNNQTASSEKDFEVIGSETSSPLKNIMFFLIFIIIFAFIIYFVREKIYK